MCSTYARLPVLLAAVLLVVACEVTETSTDRRTPEEIRISSLPSIPPDTIEELPGPQFDSPPPNDDLTVRTFPQGAASLSGPHFGIRIDWVATGDALLDTNSLVLTRKLAAGRSVPGEEIMIVAVTPDSGGQWKLGDRPKPVAELVVGGKSRPLVKVPQAPPDKQLMPTSAVLVMLSVPKDAPVRLRVADMDRVQTLDVRTGERAADAIAGYYRTSTKTIDIERKLPVGVTVRGVPYPTPLMLRDTPLGKFDKPFAMLAPWTPVQGWAASGRAWLVLPSPIVANDTLEGPAVNLAIDEPTAFRVRLPDGAEVREVGGTQQVNTWTALASSGSTNLIFDVPADFVTGTYLIDIGTARVTAEFSDGTLPARWQPAPPVVEVPLNLGS